MEYKIGDGDWIPGTAITNISSNTTVYGRLYNKNLDDEIAENTKNITNIDKTVPSVPIIIKTKMEYNKLYVKKHIYKYISLHKLEYSLYLLF